MLCSQQRGKGGLIANVFCHRILYCLRILYHRGCCHIELAVLMMSFYASAYYCSIKYSYDVRRGGGGVLIILWYCKTILIVYLNC